MHDTSPSLLRASTACSPSSVTTSPKSHDEVAPAMISSPAAEMKTPDAAMKTPDVSKKVGSFSREGSL